MNAPTIEIHQLTEVNETALKHINSLLPQLSSDMPPLALNGLAAVVNSDANAVYVAYDKISGAIVGMATLITVRQIAGTKCWVEDVVVANGYRGQGVGKRLIQAIIEAVPEDARSLNLTSNPHRTSARRLYESLGFEVRDTTVFRRRPEKTDSLKA